jgi:hypothetical protein
MLAADETKVPGTFVSPEPTAVLKTGAATQRMRRSTYTSPRTLVAPRPRPAPLTRSARHRMLAALLALVITALVLILAFAGSGGSSPPAAKGTHHRRTAHAIPRGTTPTDGAHAIATWLRNHAE